MVKNTEVSLILDSSELASGILAAFTPDFLPKNSWHWTIKVNCDNYFARSKVLSLPLRRER